MPHGKANPIRNVARTLAVDVEETRAPFRKLTVEARAYDDGVAFRYIVPTSRRSPACAWPASAPNSNSPRTPPPTR